MTATDNANLPTADVPQGAIAYRDLGEGGPIVFVHGLLVDGRLWSGVAERLASEFRCLVADWPMGSHRTAMRPDADLAPPGMAQIVVAFMDALGIERATLVGNDTGGAISQIVTAHHPDRVERLVLTNTSSYFADKTAWNDRLRLVRDCRAQDRDRLFGVFRIVV